MLTIILLVAVALLAAYAVARPVLTHLRTPWLFDAPSGEEETLRQEQIMALDALRDLAMDYRMGQISEEDYRALAAPLQKRAKQTLEAQMSPGLQGASPATGEATQATLDAELEAAILALRNVDAQKTTAAPAQPTVAVRFCTQCGEKVETSFRFCASCGAELPTADADVGETNVAVKEPATVAKEPANEPSENKSAKAIATDGTLAANDASVTTSLTPGTSGVSGTSEASAALAADSQGAAAPVAAAPVADAPVADKPQQPSMRRWWIASGLFTAVWIGAIIWIYLNGRAGQETQIPIATLPDGPVVTLAATDARALVSSTAGLVASDDLETWAQLSTDDIFLSVIPLDSLLGQSTGRSGEPAADGWLAVGPLGLWQTRDGGNSWESVEGETAALGIQQMAVGIGAPINNAPVLWGASANAIYQSGDLGESWTLVDDSLPGTVRAIVISPSELFIGTNQGVFRSPNMGDSWIDSNSVVNGRIGSTDVQALAFDQAGSNLFAGTPQGLYFLNLDNVGGWGRRSLDADVRSLAIPNGADNVLWAGTANGDVFRSTDRGVTWQN